MRIIKEEVRSQESEARMIVRYPLVAILSFGLLSLGPSAFAQGQCHQVKATFTDVFNGGCCSYGTITQGGLLNGTTVTTYSPAANPTPDPNTVSFIGELTITTPLGQLKTSNVYLYNFPFGQGTAIARINPNTSTGKFGGATGVLFLNETKTIGSGIPFTYQNDVSGEICLARN